MNTSDSIVLHRDRRGTFPGSVFYVLVVNGVACARGERDSMIDLISDPEIVTEVACTPTYPRAS